MYEIEKNIAMPDRRTKYPYKKMEVGDSFVADFRRTKGGASSYAAYSAAKAWGYTQTPTRLFIVRKISPTQIRIWRTV